MNAAFEGAKPSLFRNLLASGAFSNLRLEPRAAAQYEVALLWLVRRSNRHREGILILACHQNSGLWNMDIYSHKIFH